MDLIRYPPKRGHFFDVSVQGLETAILASGNTRAVNGRQILPFVSGRLIWELYRRSRWPQHTFSRWMTRDSSRKYFVVLLGHYFRNSLPFFALGGRKFVYMFDAWPSVHQEIVAFTTDFGVEQLFVSSSQAAEQLSKLDIKAQVHWVPEATEPENYHFRPYALKDIDVVQFGRKWDAYHERIFEPLIAHGRTYLYEKSKGQVIFPNREVFLNALARTRISICFPSNVTHPERAGNICTLTHRYLESMAAKCLVVGIQPPEMDGLFDHKPVIPADLTDPAGQLLDILAHFDDYLDLIERNYRAVLESHSWLVRWDQMTRLIS